MRLCPFNNELFELDVGQGDILKENGDVLVLGGIRGLQVGGLDLSPSDFDLISESPLTGRKLMACRKPLRGWKRVFSLHYRANEHASVAMTAENQYDSLHYLYLVFDLGWCFHRLHEKDAFRGSITLGIVPLSWRNPVLIAHALAEGLADLFWRYDRWADTNQGLRVLIRSLDPPEELYQVLDFDYFEKLRLARDSGFGSKVWYRTD